MKTLFCQKWEESERGWGTRPGGFTLHLTKEDAVKFVARFWREQRDMLGDSTPDDYTRESGSAYECPVHDDIYAFVEENSKEKSGVWCYPMRKAGLIKDDDAPAPGGRDGWVPDMPQDLTKLHSAAV